MAKPVHTLPHLRVRLRAPLLKRIEDSRKSSGRTMTGEISALLELALTERKDIDIYSRLEKIEQLLTDKPPVNIEKQLLSMMTRGSIDAPFHRIEALLDRLIGERPDLNVY